MRIAAASQRTTLTLPNCFKIFGRGGAIECAGAFRRPRPKSPFDARMIGAKHRARRKNHGKTGEGRAQESFGTARGKHKREACYRNGGIIGNALLEAELAWRIAESLEEESARDRRDRCHQNGESKEKGSFGAHRGGQITRAAIQKPTTIAAARIAKNQPKYLSSKALTGSP